MDQAAEYVALAILMISICRWRAHADEALFAVIAAVRFEFDTVTVVHEAIQDGISQSGFAEHGREPPKSNE
jgi:hypothetical protein